MIESYLEKVNVILLLLRVEIILEEEVACVGASHPGLALCLDERLDHLLGPLARNGSVNPRLVLPKYDEPVRVGITLSL